MINGFRPLLLTFLFFNWIFFYGCSVRRSRFQSSLFFLNFISLFTQSFFVPKMSIKNLFLFMPNFSFMSFYFNLHPSISLLMLCLSSYTFFSPAALNNATLPIIFTHQDAFVAPKSPCTRSPPAYPPVALFGWPSVHVSVLSVLSLSSCRYTTIHNHHQQPYLFGI